MAPIVARAKVVEKLRPEFGGDSLILDKDRVSSVPVVDR